MGYLKPFRRKIPPGRIQITGRTIFDGHQVVEFEGPLERDFLLLLRFDTSVARVQSQPFTIRYQNPNGRTYDCTPDYLVVRKSIHDDTEVLQSTIYEVRIKKKADMADPTFAARCHALRAYCLNNRMSFEVITDLEIRTPLLDNLKTLSPYAGSVAPPHFMDAVAHHISTKSPITFGRLLAALRAEKDGRINVRGHLFWMLLRNAILWDRHQPLTDDTLIHGLAV